MNDVATTYTISYTGIVNNTGASTKGNTQGVGQDPSHFNGIDLLGLFSDPGTNLAGRVMTTTYTVDTNLGQRGAQNSVVSDAIIGGYFTSWPDNRNPITSVTITIGSVSISFTPNSYGADSRLSGDITNYYGPETGAYRNIPGGVFGDFWYYPQNFVRSQDITLSNLNITTPISYNTTDSDDTYGHFYVGGGDYSSNGFNGFGEFISSYVTNVTVTANAPCFAEGTRIETAQGEIAVECLAVGDLVPARFAGLSAIKWLGRRRTDCRRHRDPRGVWPVRIVAGAFAEDVPRRDLWLSPDHGVFVDGALIPGRYLINGITIVQEKVDFVTYYHIEMAAHDIILSEGLPSESYLDTGNRSAFENGGGAIALQPDFALRVWETAACAPLVREGAKLAAARRGLFERAALLGFGITGDAAFEVIANGCVVQPESVVGGVYRFRLPLIVSGLRLTSHAVVPAEAGIERTDHRRLGVAVSSMRLDGRVFALDDYRLGSGWHEIEDDGKGRSWRWTDGSAGLILPGCCVLEVEVAMTERYWIGTDYDQSRAA